MALATAEDLTQDVFIQLICNPTSYNAGKGPVAPYLFGIMRNLARSSLRGSQPKVGCVEVSEAELVLASDPELIERLHVIQRKLGDIEQAD